MKRVFLLSPAHCSGERAGLLLNERARFDLARRVQAWGAPLGEIFSFLSGLYFRAKLAYAARFANPPRGVPGVLVITPGDGLQSPLEIVDAARLRNYAAVKIDLRETRYREPLERDTRKLADAIRRRRLACDTVLLGSIATDKYTAVLREFLDERVLFPSDFVGRGDMSRGGLLLRCLDAGQELPYVPLRNAVRHGPRPPKLERRRRP
jgi:hypothetical protein